MTTEQSWVVAKFGGTSVSSLDSINNMVTIVKGYRNKQRNVLLVVSAFSGVSNLLEEVINKPDVVDIEQVVLQLKQRHQSFIEKLELKEPRLVDFVDSKLSQLRDCHKRLKEEELAAFFALQAEIMAIGEQLSSTILKTFLEAQLSLPVARMDATEWLQSDAGEHRSIADQYLNAECQVAFDPNKASQLSALGQIVITQGFVAANSCGETVVLGRGGSDTSAAYFAVLLNAEELAIWTDVPGMFSANPRQLPEARQLLKLDYKEAQEIASTGAKVLHPRCLRPVRNAQIPVFVGSTFALDKQGTLIGSFQQSEPQVKAISVRNGVLLIAMETSDMWQRPGFLAEAFNVFFKHGLSIDQVSTSETSVTVTLDNLTQGISRERIALLIKELSSICRVSLQENCAAVSIVGNSIRTLIAQLSQAFEVFKNRSVHMLTQAANNLNFTFVIDENEAPQLVKQLHENLISQHQGNEQIGQSWSALFGDQLSESDIMVKQSWWFQHTRALEQVAHQQGASYVYSLSKVEQQIKKLQALKSIDRLFYAIKANSNAELLKHVESLGMGFECVSLQEVTFVLKLFPEIDKQRILFTPNFAPREEYKQALELGVLLTLDNLYPLEHWGDLFQGKELLLRIDTGTGKGHHSHVKTAGKEAKFGIPVEALLNAKDKLKALDISIIGLHCHVGSGILTADNWYENGQALLSLAEHFPALKFLDLGGGLGIVEKPQQNNLDLGQVDELLLKLKSLLGDLELWLEPGRFIAAECGVLVARVTQLKGKSGAGYLGIETGMNSLIRPALYGAYHPIVNLTRIEQPATEKYTVVGPICETGDKLGIDRLLPPSYEGDVLLIANTGAYGQVMSSRYNMREPAGEHIFENL